MNSYSKTARHSGDLGDIIWALASLRFIPDCRKLVLGPGVQDLLKRGTFPVPHSGVTRDRFDFIKPLLEAQGFDCSYEEGYCGNYDFNVDYFRNRFRDRDGYWKNLVEEMAKHVGVAPHCYETSWLEVPVSSPKPGVVVFARSLKHWCHDETFPWAKLLKKYSPDCVFVGTEEEHSEFSKKFGSIDYFPVDSALVLAALIKESSLVISNTTFVHAIGEGLKVNMLVEMRPNYRHAYFVRPGVSYNLNGSFVPELPPLRHGSITHIVSRFSGHSALTRSRILLAEESWNTAFYSRGVRKLHMLEKDYPRVSNEVFGDTLKAPFIKDVFRFGLESLVYDDDLLIWTNEDTVLHPDILSIIRRYTEDLGVSAFTSARLNFFEDVSLLDLSLWKVPVIQDAGHDLFAFTKAWLVQNWSLIPDFAYVFSDWDYWLAMFIRTYHKLPVTSPRQSEWAAFPSDLPIGYVFHRAHQSTWTRPDICTKAEGQKYNRVLCYRAFEKLGLKGLAYLSTPQECYGLRV